LAVTVFQRKASMQQIGLSTSASNWIRQRKYWWASCTFTYSFPYFL